MAFSIAPLRPNESWGSVWRSLHWRNRPLSLEPGQPFLPYGLGRSYGDVCLIDEGTVLDCRPLRHFISFDSDNGRLVAEAGVTLAEILDFAVPRGWFLPVVPGTSYVTLGGAVANDIHGKNHHRAGSFGCEVEQLSLRRSDESEWVCDRNRNADLFFATLGGLGLTGVVLWVAVRLRRIPSAFLEVESIPFVGLDAFWKLNTDSEKTHEHTVAWLDGGSLGTPKLRGIYHRGNPSDSGSLTLPPEPRLAIPFSAPNRLLNRFSIRALNEAYYWKNSRRPGAYQQHYQPFFFPLDSVLNWHRLYGRRGLLQYQSVIPLVHAPEATAEMFAAIRKSGRRSFLVVLKTFGERLSGGMLSFPRPGVTVALDFPGPVAELRELFRSLDEIVVRFGGAIYPAKDAVMTPETFQAGYPNLARFRHFLDPNIRSNFARRVGIV